MSEDAYFLTQDNGAGAPLHFATTYRQLDMVHHLINLGAPVNQRDAKGLTPLHRASYLAHNNGFLEIYEYLLSRGADPAVESEDYEAYLRPGRKTPVMMADKSVQPALVALEEKYASTPKHPVPHADVGDWWSLYDYGLDHVLTWPADKAIIHPEEKWRATQHERLHAKRLDKRARRRAAMLDALQQAEDEAEDQTKSNPTKSTNSVPTTSPSTTTTSSPVALLFPGQGSQAVGMLTESLSLPEVQGMLQDAEAILGYDLAAQIASGPVDDTKIAQPALLVANLAAAARWSQGRSPGTRSPAHVRVSPSVSTPPSCTPGRCPSGTH